MFCPRCGSGSLQQRSEKEFACGCGFHYFQNVASAVMVALCWQDELLVAVRARDPGRGLLDLPGGFVDPGESLEEALVRELKEELGLDLTGETPRYLGSYANVYPYDDVTYHTCDTVFLLSWQTSLWWWRPTMWPPVSGASWPALPLPSLPFALPAPPSVNCSDCGANR